MSSADVIDLGCENWRFGSECGARPDTPRTFDRDGDGMAMGCWAVCCSPVKRQAGLAMTSAVVSISGDKLVNVQTSKLGSQKTAVREKREIKLKRGRKINSEVFLGGMFVCRTDVFATGNNKKNKKRLLLVQIS